jgi:precorrin isomerase
MATIPDSINGKKLTASDKKFLASLDIPADDYTERITNPFSGESVVLSNIGEAVYSLVKGAEILGDYKMVRKGLDFFIKFYISEYKILLD